MFIVFNFRQNVLAIEYFTFIWQLPLNHRQIPSPKSQVPTPKYQPYIVRILFGDIVDL